MIRTVNCPVSIEPLQNYLPAGEASLVDRADGGSGRIGPPSILQWKNIAKLSASCGNCGTRVFEGMTAPAARPETVHAP